MYNNRRWLTTLAVVLLTVSLMMLLAACGGGDEEPTPEPAPTEAPAEPTATEPPPEPTATEAPPEPTATEVPPEPTATEAAPEPTATPQEEATAEPVEEAAPQSPLDSMEHTPDPMLVDITWEWVKRDPNGNQFGDITVPNSENYTLLFNEDGAFSAQLDCNNAAGRYATTNIENEQKGIFMELGPTQMAFCGEESLDTDMAQMFGPAQTYYFEDEGNTLIFAWAAAGPIDTYRNAAASASQPVEEEGAGPDPVAEDSEAPPVELPAAEAEEPRGVVTEELGVNVRTGPGTDYPVIGIAEQGTEGLIVGKSEDGEWWVAAAPSAPNEHGWVAAAYVEATNAGDVPVIPAPPSPETPAAEDATLANEEPYEVAQDVILYSASRVVQEGNRVYELEDIYVVAAAAGSTTELVANNAMQPALSPDRQTLAFHSMQSDKLGLGGYDLQTGQRLRFSRFHEDSNPRWSPAGDRLVFASDRQGDRRWRIYITEAVAKEDPADMTYLELDFGKDPDWHPSEELLILKGCNDEGQQCGLYTMRTDGSEPTLFTNEPSDSMPRWFPDGSAVVFMSENRDGNWELYRANSSGGEVTRLTDDPAPDGLPAVSPDGQQIAFISKRGDAWGLWVMPAAGGEATQITAIEGEQPDWLLQAVDWPK